MEFIADNIDSRREIILTADENEHVIKGKLAKHLNKDSLIESYF